MCYIIRGRDVSLLELVINFRRTSVLYFKSPSFGLEVLFFKFWKIKTAIVAWAVGVLAAIGLVFFIGRVWRRPTMQCNGNLNAPRILLSL